MRKNIVKNVQKKFYCLDKQDLGSKSESRSTTIYSTDID